MYHVRLGVRFLPARIFLNRPVGPVLAVRVGLEGSRSFQHSGTENYKEPSILQRGNLEYSTSTQSIV
jgi:hypothetical protein